MSSAPVRARLLPILLAVCALLVVGWEPAAATFPGENGVIAYSRPFFTKDSEIFTVTPDGRGHHQLSHNSRNDFEPAWSPDGRKVAFWSSSQTDVDIWVMWSNGRGEKNLTRNPNGPDLGPAWSPDGRRMAFYRQNFDGTSAIWVMDSDGSNQLQLTEDTTVNTHPAWSLDGSSILFVSNRDGNLEFYSVNPDGSGLTRLTNTPGFHEDNPSWSPDGASIAFDACQAESWPCPGNAGGDIFSMAADGTNRTRLTTDPRIDANPVWSPDGTRIAFRSDRLIYTALWVMNADGSDPMVLTPLEMQGGTDPDWQPLP
jgi:Tol biopolymer transport system component